MIAADGIPANRQGAKSAKCAKGEERFCGVKRRFSLSEAFAFLGDLGALGDLAVALKVRAKK